MLCQRPPPSRPQTTAALWKSCSQRTPSATECDQAYTLTRTWVADDGCGHVVSHTQTVEVVDTTAPGFFALNGIENGDTVTVPYNSAFGEVILPVLLDPVASTSAEHLSCAMKAQQRPQLDARRHRG